MLRICCSTFHVGPRLFGEKAPFEDRDETHGFCTACFHLELQKIKIELQICKATLGEKAPFVLEPQKIGEEIIKEEEKK